jgi:hypothetical protein
VQDWDGFFLGGRWQPAEALDDYTESQTIILSGQANRREQAA